MAYPVASVVHLSQSNSLIPEAQGRVAILIVLACAFIISIALFLRGIIQGRSSMVRRQSQKAASLRSISTNFILRLVAIAAVWIGFATPAQQLPIGPPASDANWLGIPLLLAYTTFAALIHGLLGFGLIILCYSWGIELFEDGRKTIEIQRQGTANDDDDEREGIAEASRPLALLTLLGISAMVAGWELFQWPLLFIIPAEVIVNYAVASRILELLFRGHADRVTPTNAVAEQSKHAFLRLLVFAGAALVLCAHAIPYFWLNVLGLYYVISTLDLVFASIFAIPRRSFSPRMPFGAFFTPERAVLTVPFVLILTVIGASGIFKPLTNNLGLTYQVWVVAGSAAAAYMLFKPLTDAARYYILRANGKRIMESITELALRYAELRAAGMDTPAGQTFQMRLRKTAEQAAEQMEAAERSFNRLNFPASAVLFICAISYNFLATNPDFVSLFGTEQSTIVQVIVGFVFNAISLISGIARELQSVVTLSMILIFILVGMLGTNVLLLHVPEANATLYLAGADPSSLLGSSTFLLVTLRNIVQELILLVAVGQFLYTFQVMTTRFG